MHKEVTDLILSAFYQVYRDLGFGFIERIYEIAMLMTAQDLGSKLARPKIMGRYAAWSPIDENSKYLEM